MWKIVFNMIQDKQITLCVAIHWCSCCRSRHDPCHYVVCHTESENQSRRWCCDVVWNLTTRRPLTMMAFSWYLPLCPSHIIGIIWYKCKNDELQIAISLDCQSYWYLMSLTADPLEDKLSFSWIIQMLLGLVNYPVCLHYWGLNMKLKCIQVS